MSAEDSDRQSLLPGRPQEELQNTHTPAVSAVVESLHLALAISVFAVPIHLPQPRCGTGSYLELHAASEHVAGFGV
jgi:hypothetical protein